LVDSLGRLLKNTRCVIAWSALRKPAPHELSRGGNLELISLDSSSHAYSIIIKKSRNNGVKRNFESPSIVSVDDTLTKKKTVWAVYDRIVRPLDA